MSFRSAAILPLVALVILFVMSYGCDRGRGVAGGGDSTSGFFSEYEAFSMKLEACAPGSSLFHWTDPGNTLPMMDGLEAQMAVGLEDLIRYANSAPTCADFLGALNSDVQPPACEEPGNTCDNALIRACVPTSKGNVRITIDCGAMGLSCLDGRCTLGVCSTPSCDGDSVVNCDGDGIRHEFRCGNLGLACGHGADSFQCIGTGVQCSTTTTAPICTGNILSWCLGGRLATLDCAAITDARRECSQSWLDENSDVKPAEIVTSWLHKVCAPRYSECTDGASICSEEAAYYCQDGRFEEVYCPEFGFASCTDAGQGIDSAMCTGFPAPVSP